MLFNVCCVLYVVSCVLPGSGCWSFAVGWFVVCCLLLVARCSLFVYLSICCCLLFGFVICYSLFVVRCLLFVVCHLLFDACGLLFEVRR